MKNYRYTLTHSSGSEVLEHNPINWDQINFMFARSKAYHSVLRHQVESIEFPKEGKTFIDTIVNTYGIDADITCLIEYLDKSDFTYSTLFSGVLDLAEWSASNTKTSVKAVDDSVVAKFANRDDVPIAINRANDLDENAVSVYDYLNTVTVKGVSIESRALYDQGGNTIYVFETLTADWGEEYGVSDDGFDMNDIGEAAELTPIDAGAHRWYYTNESGETRTIKYRVKSGVQGSVTVTGSGSYEWHVEGFEGKALDNTTMFHLQASGTGSDSQIIDETYDSGWIEIELDAGEQVELWHRWRGVITGPDEVLADFSFLPIYVEVFEIVEPEPDTDIEMSLFHELAAKLLEIMTGKSNPLNSAKLGRTDSEPRSYGSDGDSSINSLASGNMLRQVLFSDKPLTVTFKDFFKHLDSLYNVGFWYDYDNSEFVIKDIADFYKSGTKIIDLGEVKDLEISVYQEGYHNKISTGYKGKLEYEDLNGNQNFNVSTNFGNDGKRIKSTLDLRSPYRGDDYGIELSRKNYNELPEDQDSRYDEAIFAISAWRDSGFATLQGEDDFIFISGVNSPDTRLNLNITPKRNLLRNSNKLSIPLYLTATDVLYLNKQFELELITRKSLDPFTSEVTNIENADLDSPLYHPIQYDFTSELTTAQILQLITDPHGYVQFTSEGVTYQGYIEQVSTEPFNRRGNWTLIKKA